MIIHSTRVAAANRLDERVIEFIISIYEGINEKWRAFLEESAELDMMTSVNGYNLEHAELLKQASKSIATAKRVLLALCKRSQDAK